MCTVSFLPLGQHRYMITSNRDDHPSRATSNIVEKEVNGKKLFFPQDPKAKGTWIAISDHDQMAVLLNGAFEKHNHNPPYKESRGKMFLNYFEYHNMDDFLSHYDFENMEPFTFIVFESEELHEIIWDEVSIHHKKLDVTEKRIWASCTLYSSETQKSRKNHFDESFTEVRDVEQDEIIGFHKGNGKEDLENGFLINRNDKVQTLSITNLRRDSKSIYLSHHDLIDGVSKKVNLSTAKQRNGEVG